jgi:hypothetical protein
VKPCDPPLAGSASPQIARRLGLLRRIADAGGRILPTADPLVDRGYHYPGLGGAGEGDLTALARGNYLEARFFDRVSLCPKCSSHHLNVREVCAGCRRAHLSKEGLLHHFRCGYSGLVSEFPPGDDGSRLCPKCARRIHHLGTEYDRLGNAFICRECGLISENPPVEALCLACAKSTPAEDLISVDIFGYVLTSQGMAAIRRGSLLENDDDLVFVADMPVYRGPVILEFLDHEMKRLSSFNSRFSLLLIECAAAAGEADGGSAPSWVTPLRQCLREVDLLGQLADARYIVILPQTKRRAAEALRQQILAALGPTPPLALSAVEIGEAKDLAPVLAGRNPIAAAT